jgi:hypothetical protein
VRGTWQTTSGGGGAGWVLLGICAVLLLGSGGAVEAVSAAFFDALIAAIIVVFLTAVAVGAWLVHRARNPSPEGVVRMPLVRSTVTHELPGPERPAIEQHVHYHFHGADGAAEATKILRRGQRPEQ